MYRLRGTNEFEKGYESGIKLMKGATGSVVVYHQDVLNGLRVASISCKCTD
jgi:hypothetical protein